MAKSHPFLVSLTSIGTIPPQTCKCDCNMCSLLITTSYDLIGIKVQVIHFTITAASLNTQIKLHSWPAGCWGGIQVEQFEVLMPCLRAQ